MHSVRDFFILVWKENSNAIFSYGQSIENHLKEQFKKDSDAFCDYCSIMLITSSNNLEALRDISQARDALTYFSGVHEWDKSRVQYTQKELLLFLHSYADSETIKRIQKRLDILRKSSVIGYDLSRKIISLLALITGQKHKEQEDIYVDPSSTAQTYFETGKNRIFDAINSLENIVRETELLDLLDALKEKLDNERFSIAITGVMNAGKSTFLNALMQKELLGTSVVPETANLTRIQYAKKAYAKVHYWDVKQWEMIQKSSEDSQQMQAFVKTSEEHFKDELEEYVTQEGKVEDILLEDLQKYTSVEHSKGLCNLVSEVELFTDLQFVKNGVQIVDTPGLDDPVVQREEITKEYVASCDMLCHLMNVNQSATQKDVDFITNTLLYGNITRLLIILTQIDTISSEELDEVIAYTKKSIRQQLSNLGKENASDSILRKIEFLPVASKVALAYSLDNKEYLKNIRMSLEQSGLPKIENYLNDLLFGADCVKAKLVIEAAAKELCNILHMQNELFTKQYTLLQKSADQVQDELQIFLQDYNQQKKNLNDLQISIDQAKENLKNYFQTLELFAKQALHSLQNLIKRRVCDDVSYSLRKTKKKPNTTRIEVIIDTGIKDGFIDLVRDYRYEFVKKLRLVIENLQERYLEFETDMDDIFDTQSFLKKHFPNLILVQSNEKLIHEVNKEIKLLKKQDYDTLSQNIEIHFENAFEMLFKEIYVKLEKINHDLLDVFIQQCKAPVNKQQLQIEKTKKLYEDTQKLLADTDHDNEAHAQSIQVKMETLQEISKNIEAYGCKF